MASFDSLNYPDRFDSFFPPSTTVTPSEPLSNALPQTTKTLVLYQFFPAWDIQAYIRFANLQLHVHNTRYPVFESTGDLPQLRDGNFLVHAKAIIPHLRTHHVNLDERFTETQQAEIYAWSTMIQGELTPVLQYSQYLDPTNYTEVTRPTLAKMLPFPLNLYLPNQLQKAAIQSLTAQGCHQKAQVYQLARDCYTALEAKLGTSTYFFGESPSSLDAIVFGHIVYALSDLRLKAVVEAHGPKLIPFAQRIKERYFQQARGMTTNQQNRLEQTFMGISEATIVDAAWIAPPYRTLSVGYQDRLKQPPLSTQERLEKAEAEAIERKGWRFIVGSCIAMVMYMVAMVPVEFEEE